MQDLNDLYYFAAVVSNGGFAPAGRALNEPKSKLSRRVARLEARLGARLIERSTRRFRVTEIGQSFYERCRAVLNEAERAEAVIADAQGEPRGIVRFSCPTGLIDPIASILPDFLARYPKVDLQLVATNRRVDLIEERIDIALRVRTVLDADAALTMRSLTRSRRILMASPALAHRLGNPTDIASLPGLPTVAGGENGDNSWVLVGPGDRSITIEHKPRLACSDFPGQRAAAIAGVGITLLPDHVCWPALKAGQLIQVFPDWYAPEGTVHLVFTTRRGLPPAVRALIDHLADRFRDRNMLQKAELEMRGIRRD